jgi:leader peptidase (prepilin peptidase) / N-methyltransferase
MANLFLSALFGLIVGSFLGCCVYRIPRDISLWSPKRSFCPKCHSSLRWIDTIPIVSWFLLQGRCAVCRQPISWRYPVIELLTTFLFVAATYRFGFPIAIPIWFFYAALLATTFIDLEFLLIPDLISLGCIALGLLSSALVPGLHGVGSPWVSLGISAAGACIGAATLYVVGELGKLAFGRYKLVLSSPVAFRFEDHPEQDPCLFIDNERFGWDEHFFRRSDRIRLQASNVELNGEPLGDSEILFLADHLQFGKRFVPLSEVRQLTGMTSQAEFPREAMGRGDVKLLAAIGSFVGWKGILFCVPVAAFLGCFFGVIAMLLGRRGVSSRVPFGPFLSLAAVIWTQAGPEFLGLYWRWVTG